MSPFAHSAMLLVMLIHSVCGSCWHHAHECSCGVQTPAGQSCDAHAIRFRRGAGCSERKPNHGCCHHESPQARPAGPLDSEPDPVHHSRCQDASCLFLAPDLLAAPRLLAGLPEIVTDAGFHAMCPQPVSEEQVRDYRTEPISAVSHCALFQVWRI